MFKQVFKGLVPLAIVGLGLATSACGESMHISIGDDDGVPLSELDMSGAAPTKLVLAGPDKVTVTEGDKLDIQVSGDREAAEALRFNLKDGTLGIMRQKDWRGSGIAAIAVTMPPVQQIVLAGSGDISVPTLVDKAEVNIAGSGKVAVARVAASKLQINVMGSGTLTAAGQADRLDFNVAGTGKLAARGLKVDRAEINIAGSGGGEFASDGKVEARIAGSGDVTVYGRADCSVSAMGSGKVNCRPADGEWRESAAAPAAPTPPAAPGAPSAPAAPTPGE